MIRLIVALVLALVFSNTSFAQCKNGKCQTQGSTVPRSFVVPQSGCQGPKCTNGACDGPKCALGGCTTGSCISSYSFKQSFSSGQRKGLFGRIRHR